MEKLLDLGHGLKIAKVNIEELREQDLNARSMNSSMFERLTANIKKDKRLESLPLIAETDKGYEIVSGHHRVRACRTAGVTEIYVLCDDSGLTRDEIRSKQLSHNSIQGEDNQQLVREIYEMIDDAEAKLASYIDPNMKELFDRVTTKDITFDISIKTILVNFLSYEEDVFRRAAERINGDFDEIYVAELETLDSFSKAMKRVGKEYDIRAMNTTFTKMAEIVLESLGEEPNEEEMTPIRDVLKTSYIPNDTAELLRNALKKAEKDKIVDKSTRWMLIDVLCREYLGDASKV